MSEGNDLRPSLALWVSITVRRTAAIDIMPRSADSRLPSRRVAITVRGIVQGVGFRPFVFNTARSMGLAGWVQNEAGMVRIEVQGVTADVDLFVMTLRAATPPQASIDALEISEVPCQNVTCGDFSIRASPAGGVPWPAIPADLAICGAASRKPARRVSGGTTIRLLIARTAGRGGRSSGSFPTIGIAPR